MDEDPDFDYEMEPQATYAVLQGSAEEAMDELSSEGMAMSDAGSRSEVLEKADVDFNDASIPRQAVDQYPSLPDAPSQAETGGITEVSKIPLEDATHPIEAAHEFNDEAVLEHVSHFEESGATRSDQDGDHLDGSGQSDRHLIEQRARGVEEEEHHEQHKDDGVLASQPDSIVAPDLEESDQLDEISGEDVAENGDQDEIGQNGYAHYDVENGQDTAIRVTFHGQDFVLFSQSDIPTFLAMPSNGEQTDSTYGVDDVVHIEAPALQISKDVLWQPLDSLFAGLREKNALGDFLDESHELHIAFPDLDLDVAEDNLYCREISLDDLLQLHHGLGLPTSLHIQVLERPRFITKYNELAQHVAGLLANQLQHSSDDEEEAANSGNRARDVEGVVEPVRASERFQASVGIAAKGAFNSQHAEAPQTNGDVAVDHNDARATTGPHRASTSHLSAVSQNDASEYEAVQGNAHEADEHADPRQEDPDNQLETREEVEGGLEQPAGELDAEEWEDKEGVVLSHEETAEENGEPASHADGDPEAALAEEAEEAYQAAHAGSETVANEAEEKAEDEDEVDDVREPEGDEEKEEHEQGDGQMYEKDYAEEREEDEDEGEGEGEGEEYVDEVVDQGEDVEETFYTTVNSGSEAEEDELEDPEHGVAHSSAYVQPADGLEATYAVQGAEDEQEWQGTCDAPSLTDLTLSTDMFVLASPRTNPAEDEAEEQIFEYTEDQDENDIAPGSASTPSTPYHAGAQHKRGLDDEDEDEEAAYEQDDYEAGSKRVKVD